MTEERYDADANWTSYTRGVDYASSELYGARFAVVRWRIQDGAGNPAVNQPGCEL